MSKVRLLARAHAHAVSSLVAACLLACALNSPARARQQPAQPGEEQQEHKPFGPLTYRQIGPYRGGRVGTVAGVPSQPMVYYFGATGGGVWKTTDGGSTWEPLGEQTF